MRIVGVWVLHLYLGQLNFDYVYDLVARVNMYYMNRVTNSVHDILVNNVKLDLQTAYWHVLFEPCHKKPQLCENEKQQRCAILYTQFLKIYNYMVMSFISCISS